MSRASLLALAGFLLLPSVGQAQDSPSLPSATLSITPLVGFRTPLVSKDQTQVILPGLVPTVVDFETSNSGGGIGGAEVDLRLFGPVGIVGSFVYTNPDDLSVLAATNGVVTRLEVNGPSVWFAKVGVSYRLPEPDPDNRRFHPAAFVVAGPAMVQQRFSGGIFTNEETVQSWGANVGIKVLQGLGTPNVALYLGVEDYITFWDTDGIERRVLEGIRGLEPGALLAADLGYDRTHVLMLNLGLSFRL